MPGWESRASTVLYSRSSSFSVRVRCTWRWHAPHSGTVRCSSSRLNDRFARLFPWRLRGIKWCLVRRSTTRVHSPQIPPLSVILAITYRIVPGTLCRATVDSAIPQPGHRVGVHVLAIPEGEVMVCALDFEPELLIQGDCDGVSKYENAAGSLPCSYRRRRRRAVGIGESVLNSEDAFAEWHGYEDVVSIVQNQPD